MKKMVFSVLGLLMLSVSFVYAGEGGGALGVGQIQIWDPHWVLFTTEFHNNAPDCAKTDKWLVNLETPAGRAMLAVLLSSQANGISVTVWGSGTCEGFLGEAETAIFISQDI